MIRIPQYDPVEYLTRRKFPYYRDILLPKPISPLYARGGDGLRSDFREKALKEIEAYQAELRAKPPEELQEVYAQEQANEQQAKAELAERQQFFNQPHAKADFVHWSKATYWTLDEAIALSFGKAPDRGSDMGEREGILRPAPRSRFALRLKYGRVRDLALRAKAWKQLYDPVLPSIFLAWARRMEIKVPGELIEQVEKHGIVIADWKIFTINLKSSSISWLRIGTKSHQYARP